MDVIKAQGKNKKNGSADKALGYIRKLYRIEKEAREKGMSAEEVYQVRQQKSKPILNKFEQWLKRTALQTPPNGLLGKAVAYALNQWHRLIIYVEDGQGE